MYNTHTDFGALGPRWAVFIKTLPSRLRDLCGRGGGKIVKLEVIGESTETAPSRQNRADAL